jgi:hypothetical protein
MLFFSPRAACAVVPDQSGTIEHPTMSAPTPAQEFKNHAQYVPLFHFVLVPVLGLTFIGSLVNLYLSFGDHRRLYSASLIVVLTACAIITAFLARIFALKAQDRAIRAEENLRHLALTGKLLDSRLGIRQIIALRFAGDGEFVTLARRAADENLDPKTIKEAVREWRGDYHRV